MNRFLLRILTGILIPCLLVDPSWSQISFPPPAVRRTPLSFTHQAVVAALGSARRRLTLDSESPIQFRQMIAAFILSDIETFHSGAVFQPQTRGIVPEWVLGYAMFLAGAMLVGVYVFLALYSWLNRRIRTVVREMSEDQPPVEHVSEAELNEQLIELEDLLKDIHPAWRWPQTLRNLETLMDLHGFRITPTVARLRSLKERDWATPAEKWNHHQWETFISEIVRDVVNPKLKKILKAPGLVLDEGIIRMETPEETRALSKSGGVKANSLLGVALWASGIAFDSTTLIVGGLTLLFAGTFYMQRSHKTSLHKPLDPVFPFAGLRPDAPPKEINNLFYQIARMPLGGLLYLCLPPDFQDGDPIVVVFPGKLLELVHTLKDKFKGFRGLRDLHHWLYNGIARPLTLLEWTSPVRLGVAVISSIDAQDMGAQVRRDLEGHTVRASQSVDTLLWLYPRSRLIYVLNSYGGRMGLEDIANSWRSRNEVAAVVLLNTAVTLGERMARIVELERPLYEVLYGKGAGNFIADFMPDKALTLRQRLSWLPDPPPQIYISGSEDWVVDGPGARGLMAGSDGAASIVVDKLKHSKSWENLSVWSIIQSVVQSAAMNDDVQTLVVELNGRLLQNMRSYPPAHPLIGVQLTDAIRLYRPTQPATPTRSLSVAWNHLWRITTPQLVRSLQQAVHVEQSTIRLLRAA
jgi:hypothetical protein